MMQCEICRDTTGPFEIIEHKGRCKLVCEDCAKIEKKGEIRQTGKPKDKRKKYYYRTL